MVYFPPEIMREIFSFHNPYLNMERKIECIHADFEKQAFKLSKNGLDYQYNNDPRDTPITKHCYKNISMCVDDVKNIYVPRKTVTIGSYGGKHEVERFRSQHIKGDVYISNGEFIIAMLLAGFKMKRTDRGPNCEFYASKMKSK